MKLETFVLPDIPASLSCLPERVAVVGLVGKSSLSEPGGDKGAPLSAPLYGSLFPEKPPPQMSRRDGGAAKTPPRRCHISGYYDPSRRAVMLQLCGPFDAALLREWLQRNSSGSGSSATNNKKVAGKENVAPSVGGGAKRPLEATKLLAADSGDSTDTVDTVVAAAAADVDDGEEREEEEEEEDEEAEEAGSKHFLVTHAEMKVEFARALLLMFQVCHLVVLRLPGSRFDLSYVGLFTALDNARQRFLPKTAARLRSAGVTSRWYQAGRLCSPRVLFLFDRPPGGCGQGQGGGARKGGGGHKQHHQQQLQQDIKKLEHALEDQVYRVLRKARVVTNRSADSLFSIPKNDEFVHVQRAVEDRLSRAVRDLVYSCQKFNGSGGAGGAVGGGGTAGNQQGDNPFGTFGRNPYIDEDYSCTSAPPAVAAPPGTEEQEAADPTESGERCFSSFLQQHIDTALGPGFEDNVGKYAATTPAHFEVPKLKTWCNAVLRLHALYYGGGGGGGASDGCVSQSATDAEQQPPAASSSSSPSDAEHHGNEPFASSSTPSCAKELVEALREALNVDVRFSEARCAKVLPVAKALYLEGLPSHYGTAEHMARLGAALASLRAHARGPRVARAAAHLAAFALDHWTGRQLCEAPSLTGRPCQRPKICPTTSKTGGAASQGEDPVVAILCEHSSGVVTTAACDCGRTLGRRDDPYEPRRANCDYYAALARECACGAALQRIAFPVFQPSVKDFRAAKLFGDDGPAAAKSPVAASTGTGGGADNDNRRHKRISSKQQHANNDNRNDASSPSVTMATHGAAGAVHSSEEARGSSTAPSLDNATASRDDDDDDDDDVDLMVDGADDEDDLHHRRLLDDSKSPPQDDIDDEIETGGGDRGGVKGDDDVDDNLTEDEGTDVNEIVIQVSENPAGGGAADGGVQADKDRLVRQPSTTEYLPGMLHTASPAGLLPQFPSWSLVCLGPSSLYSHNLGLSEAQHPGFITGANFLLPWDVTVRLEHTQLPWWPPHTGGGAGGGGGRTGRKAHKHHHHYGGAAASGAGGGGGNKSNEFVVKIFVGAEYECPRGHRFMMSAPDKILRATTGLVKDSGNRVANSDMPLFYECPCRTPKPQLAQLMRVHVVSPKAPVHVTLDPRVQPGPPGGGAPVFVTGFPAPVRLTQSSYWVLRLPYVYVGDRGAVYANPGSAKNAAAASGGAAVAHGGGGGGSMLQYGRLLQGMYGISEMERE